MINTYVSRGSDKTNTLVDDIPVGKPSMVDHPIHYNREGAMECIDEMEMIFGPEMVMNFCLGCVFKYRYRAGLKNNGYEDLEKSDWYMRKYKELKDKMDNKSYTYSTYSITPNDIPQHTQHTSTL